MSRKHFRNDFRWESPCGNKFRLTDSARLSPSSQPLKSPVKSERFQPPAVQNPAPSRLNPYYPPPPFSNYRSNGSGQHSSPPPARNRKPEGLLSPPLAPSIINPAQFFSSFSRVNHFFFRCKKCGHRVKAFENGVYLFIHRFGCSNEIVADWLHDPVFCKRLVEILSDVKQVLELRSKRSAEARRT